jgi:hypothetical protein
MKVTAIKSNLADIYGVNKVTSKFIDGVAADDSELHSTAISIFLRKHPGINRCTKQFWYGIYQATLVNDEFAKVSESLKLGLLEADNVRCIIADVFSPLENIRKFTVATTYGFNVQFTCSLLDNKPHVSYKKVSNFRVPTHDISRYTSYYVERALTTLSNQIIS